MCRQASSFLILIGLMYSVLTFKALVTCSKVAVQLIALGTIAMSFWDSVVQHSMGPILDPSALVPSFLLHLRNALVGLVVLSVIGILHLVIIFVVSLPEPTTYGTSAERRALLETAMTIVKRAQAHMPPTALAMGTIMFGTVTMAIGGLSIDRWNGRVIDAESEEHIRSLLLALAGSVFYSAASWLRRRSKQSRSAELGVDDQMTREMSQGRAQDNASLV